MRIVIKILFTAIFCLTVLNTNAQKTVTAGHSKTSKRGNISAHNKSVRWKETYSTKTTNNTSSAKHITAVTSGKRASKTINGSINSLADERTAKSADEAETALKDLSKIALNPSSNYVHPETQTGFPYKIGEFVRSQIVTYKNTPSKIDAIYESDSDGKKSSFTISLIPDNEGVEGRLRNVYLKEILPFEKEEKRNFPPMAVPVKFNGNLYTCNGIKGTYKKSDNEFSRLTVYECGTWLLKISMKANNLDSIGFEKFNQTLIQRFDPSRLTSLRPLNLKSNVDFERDALKDTIMTGALVGSAFKKMDWAIINVSNRERASGFPDLYLNMHLAAWKEFINLQKKKKDITGSYTAKKYVEELYAINNAGFLAEFVMEEYNNIMIVPDYITLNLAAFNKWKEDKNLTINLQKKLYTICYRKQ